MSTPTLGLPLGERELLAALRAEAHPLTGDARDYDALLARVGDARIVLLGEASHGTHEFYRERARITRRLIDELGFAAVAIEGDWPDALSRQPLRPRGGDDRDAEEALGGFSPLSDLDVAQRGRTRLRRVAAGLNDSRTRGRGKVGFYGLDLYSLGASIEAVIAYLDDRDPQAAQRARARYECLQPYAGEAAGYGEACCWAWTSPAGGT